MVSPSDTDRARKRRALLSSYRSPLAIDAPAFRELGHRVVDMITEYFAGVRERPVTRPLQPVQERHLSEQRMPEEGAAPDAIIDFIASHVLPHPMGNCHPRFFAWIVGAPSPIGVLSNALATAINSSSGGADHAAIHLETCVNRWLMELIGFPTEGSHGLLVSGGSIANLTGIAVARHWAAREAGWDVRAEGLQGTRPRLVLYASEQSHFCIGKAAEVLGLGAESVRTIAVDDAYRIDLAALRDAVRADRAAGCLPFCAVGTAGTVNCGVIDPLHEMAELCADEQLWFHIDGAYGGWGVIDPALAPAYAGMARADSIALDLHKWLDVPIDCGCVMVRDGTLQHEAFSQVPAYLRLAEADEPDTRRWPMEYGIELTRSFRALRAWATLMHLGKRGARAMIVHQNALARHLAAAIEAAPDLELLAPVTLSIVCFRYVPPGWQGDEAGLDELNRAICQAVNAEGAVFFTPTKLRGRYALRAAIVHHDTKQADVDLLLAAIVQAGAVHI